jgi:outer membrane protein assembly factor BamD
MTVSRVWRRLAPIAPLTLAALLAACGSTPKDDDNTPAGVDRLYAQAKENMQDGNYDAAAKALEKVEGRAAGTLLSQQATIDLAYTYYKQRDRAQALSTLDRFIKLHPSSPVLDYALYLRGIVNFNDDLGFLSSFTGQDLSERDQQASRDAYQSFRQLVDQFPASKYTPDAQARMDYIVNALADYEVHVARYYFRRGAYVAAANRAQQAVQDFQQSPAAEEALYILVRSYDELGLTLLRDDADRVLRKNFPSSRHLKQGLTTSKGAWWQLWK